MPFEAARIGCDVYASDLNPVAALLTWAALNIVGGGKEIVEEVKQAVSYTHLDVYKRQIRGRLRRRRPPFRSLSGTGMMIRGKSP